MLCAFNQSTPANNYKCNKTAKSMLDLHNKG